MRRVRYQVACSLDGYIAGPDDDFGWIPPELAFDFEALAAQFDTLLMGRRTFEIVRAAGESFRGKRVVVASRTLRPERHPEVEVVRDGLQEWIRQERCRSGRDIWLDGGGALPQWDGPHGVRGGEERVAATRLVSTARVERRRSLSLSWSPSAYDRGMDDAAVAWITLIGPDEAEGRLRATYARIAGPDGQVDRVLQLHGLRPHTLDGHLALYKATLHHAGNTLPNWFLELLGVYVSRLNGCAYCVAHHHAGLARLVGEAIASALADAAHGGDDGAAGDVVRAHHGSLGADPRLAEAIGPALAYARALTRTPGAMERENVDALRAAGLDDGEVLEVNQVVAYFAYVNRAVNGLGVSHAGEPLGLAPRNAADEGDVRHG